MELHHGLKRKQHAFGAAQLPYKKEGDDVDETSTDAVREVDYIAAARRDVTAAAHRIHNFGLTRGDDDESAAAAQGTSIRFLSADRDENGSLRLRFEFGVRHADGTLIDPEDPDTADIALRGKSTLHPFRATLITRPDLTRGLLAVEARGRSCPMSSVIRGLNGVSEDNWRLRPISHLAGEAAMITFIGQSEVKRVSFDQWSYEADGARDRKEVSMAVLTEIEGEAVKERVKRWAREYFGFLKEHVTEKEVEEANLPDMSKMSTEEKKEVRRQIRQKLEEEKRRARIQRRLTGRKVAHEEADVLKQTVFANREGDVDIDFTDVSVELDNHGASKTYNPLSDFGRFTYGISDRYPSDEEFYSSAEGTALDLLDQVQGLQLNT
ncbi:hypothetical protein [Mycobacterium lehmannii]|uniref:hypothetical protein n=1 Tax=Mycobacterium lehmannii TaxID=2048550 RepID=UPI000B93A337|nr:hypothetical protein [Mycobacterium lehmannii]